MYAGFTRLRATLIFFPNKWWKVSLKVDPQHGPLEYYEQQFQDHKHLLALAAQDVEGIVYKLI